MRVIFNPTIVAPVAIIGIPVFLILLDLFKEHKTNKIVISCLIALLVATGYLAHIAEVILLLIFFIFFSLINDKNKWHLNIGILVGLLLVAIIDLAAPCQLYLFSVNQATGGLSLSLEYLFATLLLAVSTFISFMKSAKDKLSFKLPSLPRRIVTIAPRIWAYARLVSYLSLFLVYYSMVIYC